MSEVATSYHIKFTVPDHDWGIECTAYDIESVKNIISACAAFNSGDECECFINGEKVVLENDWGLLLTPH